MNFFRFALHWLYRFMPAAMPVNAAERVRSTLGALSGLLIAGWLSTSFAGSQAGLPFLIAPMGASAVLLFAIPASPLAQPWSVVGGNVLSATVGIACARFIPDPMLAAAMAVSLAIGSMFALRCLHPPGGAIAVMAALGGPALQAQGFWFALSPVGLNSVLMVCAAIVFNNLTGRRYPHAERKRTVADATTPIRQGFTHEDLETVLRRHNQVIDIGRDELEQLLVETELLAWRRRLGNVTCGDIMSPARVIATPDTPPTKAWEMLSQSRVHALPVVDSKGELMGIATLSDLLGVGHGPGVAGYARKLRAMVGAAPKAPIQHRRLSEIMTTEVTSVRLDTHIVELMPLLSEDGFRQAPVVDKHYRLAGMVTRSDLIAAICRSTPTDEKHAIAAPTAS